MRRPLLVSAPLALAVSALLAACSSGGGGILSAPGPSTGGVPGFDLRDHPGTEAMGAWREASPYRWVGFYLEAPCYTGTTWRGRRSELVDQGWGLAVLFVGEQDWASMGAAPAMTARGEEDATRCTASNLSAERGRSDASAAASSASGEGFPAGTVVFLDVERVSAPSTALVAYARSWIGAMLEDGRYVPGVYAHARNADELYAVAVSAYAGAGETRRPPMWVAGGDAGFDIARAPSDSGFSFATAWQGAFNVDETWGGVTLRVDRNVARSASPSAPR